MKKITRLDFQIINLEKMGSNISPMEKCKLDNLREQKCFMQENGIVLKLNWLVIYPEDAGHPGGE